jgi:hypothetical protein
MWRSLDAAYEIMDEDLSLFSSESQTVEKCFWMVLETILRP